MSWPFIPLSVREDLAAWDPENPDFDLAVKLADWCHYWHGPGSDERWTGERLLALADDMASGRTARVGALRIEFLERVIQQMRFGIEQHLEVGVESPKLEEALAAARVAVPDIPRRAVS